MADPALDDPFFRVVREQHPDLTLVMLPPVVTGPQTQDPAERARAAELVGELNASTSAITALASALRDARLRERWDHDDATGARRRHVRAVVRHLEPGEAPQVLAEIGDALLADGWDARPYADGSARLEARRGELAASAAVHGERVAVDLVTPWLMLTDEVATELEATR